MDKIKLFSKRDLKEFYKNNLPLKLTNTKDNLILINRKWTSEKEISERIEIIMKFIGKQLLQNNKFKDMWLNNEIISMRINYKKSYSIIKMSQIMYYNEIIDLKPIYKKIENMTGYCYIESIELNSVGNEQMDKISINKDFSNYTEVDMLNWLKMVNLPENLIGQNCIFFKMEKGLMEKQEPLDKIKLLNHYKEKYNLYELYYKSIRHVMAIDKNKIIAIGNYGHRFKLNYNIDKKIESLTLVNDLNVI